MPGWYTTILHKFHPNKNHQEPLCAFIAECISSGPPGSESPREAVQLALLRRPGLGHAAEDVLDAASQPGRNGAGVSVGE